jgi:phage shock protein A
VPNLIVSAVSTFDNKGLKKGKKEISAFDKNVQSLGKTFAKVFGSIALVNFGKNAVNAFIDSEKAAAKLRTTVSNLGLEFEQPGIEKYLDKLSLQFGIVDESLIPGFQRLLIVTKDVAQAQSLFETALNVSAGTGKDLTAVSTSLSKAYLGDNAALGRLGVGLSKAQLKSASFLELQNTLNVNFAGQALAAVEGYAGSMAKLTVAVDKSKEAIGKGLLDALAALSGSSDIDTFTTKMVKAAEKVGNAFRTVGDVIGLLNPNASVKVNGKFVRRSDVMKQNQGGYSGIPAPRKAETKAIKDAVTYRKQENALLKAKTAVDQLRDKFDLERIGLAAALNAATDEETKLRIKAQIAILDNNEALAKKLLAEMAAAEAANKLATSFTAVGDATIEYFKKLSESLVGTMAYFNMSMQQILAERLKESGKTSLGGDMTGGGFTPLTPSYFQNLGSQLQGSSAYAGMSAGQISLERARESGNRSLDVNLVVSAPSGNAFAQLVAESIQVAGRDGYSTAPNGGLP